MHNSLIQMAAALATQMTPPAHPDVAVNVTLATAILFITGLCLAFPRASHLRGPHKLLPFGPIFYGVSLAIFGLQHFVLLDVVKQAVPAWMPGHAFWTLLVGAALIATCLSLFWNIKAPLAALLTGIMFLLFVLLIHAPNVIREPHDRFLLAALLRDLSLGGGALAFAASTSTFFAEPHRRWLVLFGRYLFAIAMLVFGVEHFLHPDFAPGVPLEELMPAWVPAHLVLSWLVGLILIVCGVCLVINRRARTAAIALGATYLLLTLFIYLPREIMHPSIEISGELDYVADTLIMSGAALLLARALELPRQRPQPLSTRMEG